MMFLMFPTNSRAEGVPRGLGEFPARGKAAINVTVRSAFGKLNGALLR